MNELNKNICIECFGTGNKNFWTKSLIHFPCDICINKKNIEECNILSPIEYNNNYCYKKNIEKILENLSIKELDPYYIEIYKRCIEIYNILEGPYELLEKVKKEIKRLEDQNKCINIVLNYNKLLNERNVEKMMLKDIDKIKETLIIIKNLPTTSNKLYSYVNNTLNLIEEIEKQNVNKINKSIEIGESINIDLIKHLSIGENSNMTEKEKIIWMNKFIIIYKKYAEYCKNQSIKPQPIPNIDILNRKLEYITLSNGYNIYNQHYKPNCIVM